jgi:hypothetical protein
MYQVWKYKDAIGVERVGVAYGCSDFGGTDVAQKFWRIGSDGLPISYENGGREIDIVRGAMLKGADRIGAVRPGEPWVA